MTERIASARSCSNIAFIKYWGNRDNALRLPSNGSISMNLRGLETVTTACFSKRFSEDRFILNHVEQSGEALARMSKHIDFIREMAQSRERVSVVSENSFPTGVGIASSASGFAALTVAACSALELGLNERELSRIARLGSGSACRSIPGGFVEWPATDNEHDSFASPFAGPDHWALVDLVAVVSERHKAVGSTGGHALASTSALQSARVADTPRRLMICREAITNKDFLTLANIIEEDTLMMHGVMMTSRPSLIYWNPPTMAVMSHVLELRMSGIPVAFTIDAGPNVHVISTQDYSDMLTQNLRGINGVTDVLRAVPGDPTVAITEHLAFS